MANCRFLSQIVLDSSNNQMRVTDSADGAATITLDAGTYYMSSDASSSDLTLEIETQLNAAFAANYSVFVGGATLTGSSVVDGTIRIVSDSTDFTLNITHADWTSDPRIIGERAGSDVSSSSSIRDSQDNHRYGWYPQTTAYDIEAITQKMNAHVSESTSGFVDVVHFRTYEEANIEVEYIPTALVREEGAKNSGRASDAGLTQNDPNASIERFVIDIVESDLQFRYYKDITAYTTADFHGPYKLPGTSPLYTDPLATSSQPFRNADYWNTRIDGREVAT